jgi:putative ABC transport system ATP-binding protein
LTVAESLIACRGLVRTYTLARGHEVPVLRGVDLDVGRGEFVALMGPSGSGKSTLMHLLGLLDHPDGGSYHLEGAEVSGLDDAARSRLRGRRIGFVFQSFNLITQSTIDANVELPLAYLGIPRHERHRRAAATLERLGLGHRLRHRPLELSGGEQQRVAIARALVAEPAVLFADEPTGNLDSRTGAQVMDLLADLHRDGLTLVIVTHDPGIAARTERTVHLKDGRIENGAVAVRSATSGLPDLRTSRPLA